MENLQTKGEGSSLDLDLFGPAPWLQFFICFKNILHFTHHVYVFKLNAISV